MIDTHMTTVTVRLVKSLIGTNQKHRKIIQGLGLRKNNSSATLQDTPAVRGMLEKVKYLVKVES